jgi:WD40 repeat protein
MTRAGRLSLVVLTAVAAAACHSQSDILNRRDGGAGMGGMGGRGGAGGGAPGGTGGVGNVAGAGGVGIGFGSAFPNGIGSEWKWKTGVVAHTAGPYAPCGMLGAGAVTFGAASPTAPEFAAASRAGVVLFYSTETGKQVRSPYYVAGPVNGVDYSRDGTKLIVASDVGIQIVRLSDGKVLLTRQFVAQAAALSPDGSLLAALGSDGSPGTAGYNVQLLRVSDGARIAMLSHDVRAPGPPQFSPDGKVVVVGSLILSVPALEMLPTTPQFTHSAPDHWALSPDGTKIGGGGYIFELATGRELKAPRLGQDGIYFSAFSPDGTVYAETDNLIHLWRTSDWTPIGTPTPVTFTAQAGSDGVGGFFFSDAGTRLIFKVQATIGADLPVFQIMNVPDLTTGATIAEPMVGWGPAVLSPDGSLLMEGLLSGKSTVWRTTDLSEVSRLPEQSLPNAFLANGMLQIYLWIFNPLDGTKLGYAIASAISPDGRLAVAPSTNLQWLVIRLADLKTQAVIDGNALAYTIGPDWVFSRDNRYVVGSGRDPNGKPKVIVYDAMTGTAVTTLAAATPAAIATTASGAVRVAAFVPVENDFNADVRVFSVPDGQPLFDIKQATAKNWQPSGGMPTMAFSPDGTLIAAGAAGIRIFEVETGRLRETLPAHFDVRRDGSYSGVYELAFSPTGQIVSVGWDATMRLWCSP